MAVTVLSSGLHHVHVPTQTHVTHPTALDSSWTVGKWINKDYTKHLLQTYLSSLFFFATRNPPIHTHTVPPFCYSIHPPILPSIHPYNVPIDHSIHIFSHFSSIKIQRTGSSSVSDCCSARWQIMQFYETQYSIEALLLRFAERKTNSIQILYNLYIHYHPPYCPPVYLCSGLPNCCFSWDYQKTTFCVLRFSLCVCMFRQHLYIIAKTIRKCQVSSNRTQEINVVEVKEKGADPTGRTV